MALLADVSIPETLISQYLGACYEGVRSGAIQPSAHELALAKVDKVLADYYAACL